MTRQERSFFTDASYPRNRIEMPVEVRSDRAEQPVTPRLEKRLKDFANGGLVLVWKRQGMYFFAALLAALFINPMLALACFGLIQAAELIDCRVSKSVMAWTNGTLGEAEALRWKLLASSTFNALAVTAFCVGFAYLEGPVIHQMPLFILFAAGLFAAVNNHQVPLILYTRLVIYGTAFLAIPIYDLWVVRPPMSSTLWLQLATAIFVLYFVIECADIFLKLYRKGLDQMDALREERDRVQAAYDVKSQFVSVVSHELRTPLTSISASLELLNSGALDACPDKAARMLDIARLNSRKLKSLVVDLLNLQQLEADGAAFTMTAVDLAPSAERAIAAMQGAADARSITVYPPARIPPVLAHADPERLDEVFRILLSNAIKFSDIGGAVTLSVWQDGHHACCAVADHGIGIPEGSEDVVFGTFSQVDSSDHRQHDGAGLGLSIARYIVTALHGTIRYQSRPGEGTTFTVCLPLADQSTRPDS